VISVYRKPAFDGRPQKRAAGLIDTADDDRDPFLRCRDGGWHGDVDTSSASAMTNSRCRLVRSRPVAARNDDPARVVCSEFPRYPPPDHAIAADDGKVLIIQAARLRRAFGAKGLGKSSDEIPFEITYFGTVGDSMPRTTTAEHDFIGKIRIEGGVIDLANNGRQLGNPHGRRKFVVKASRDLDLEPPLGPLDHLQRVPACRATLIDDDLLVAEVLEGAILLGRVIGEVPLSNASRENSDAHHLKRWLLSEFPFQIDVDPQWQRAHLDHFCWKARINGLSEPAGRQFAFHEEQPREPDLATQQMQQDRGGDLP
jgi:hypothetical protein